MGLVKDDHVVIRQHSTVATLTEPEIGEVERVVDDDEIGSLRSLPGRLGEAGSRELTRSAEATVGADGELGPERLRRLGR